MSILKLSTTMPKVTATLDSDKLGGKTKEEILTTAGNYAESKINTAISTESLRINSLEADVDTKLKISTFNTHVTNYNGHLLDHENPHAVTKVQLELGNVFNYGCTMSTSDPAKDKYALTGAVKAAYDLAFGKVSIVDFNAFVALRNNPHVVNKTQVGLSNVANYGVTIDPANISKITYTTAFALSEVKKVADSALQDGGTYSTLHMTNWYRSTGATGVYFESYGGGLHMTDDTWIRCYGGKSLHTEGQVAAVQGVISKYSDMRLKNIQGKIHGCLKDILKWDVITYTANALAVSLGYDADEVEVGLIAQQIAKHHPALVKPAPCDIGADGKSKTGKNLITLMYDRVVVIAIGAIKEMYVHVRANRVRIVELEKRLIVVEKLLQDISNPED